MTDADTTPAARRSRSRSHAADPMPLVSAALATLVFCDILGNYGIRDYLPDFVQQLLPFRTGVSYALLLLALCRSRRRWSPLGLIGVAAATTLLLLPNSREGIAPEFVTLAFALAAIGRSDITPLFRTYFWALVAGVAIMVVMDALGLSAAGWRKPNTYWAYGYGTGHPNTIAALLYFTLVALALSLDRDRYRLPLLACCGATTLFSFWGLGCRTVAVLVVLLALALALEGLRPDWVARLDAKGTVPLVAAAGTIVLATLMVLGTRLYGTMGLFDVVDRLTNMRLSHGNDAYRVLGGFSLFGRQATFASREEALFKGTKWITVDSAYVRSSLIVGLATGLCVLVLLCRAARDAMGERGSTILWVSVGLAALYCATESSATYPSLNVSLLVLARGLAPRRRRPPQGQPPDSPALPSDQPAATSDAAGPRPAIKGLASAAPAAGIVLYAALLALLSYRALTNGTGAHTVAPELPPSISIACTDGLLPPDLAATEAQTAPEDPAALRTLIQAEVSDDDRIAVSLLGASLHGLLDKTGTKGQTTQYRISPERREDDALGGRWGIHLSVPGRTVPATGTGLWLIDLVSYRDDGAERHGLWLRLEAGGSARYGFADKLVSSASDEDLVSLERAGTWQVTTEGRETRLTCSFDDQRMDVLIQGRDA